MKIRAKAGGVHLALVAAQPERQERKRAWERRLAAEEATGRS